MKAKLLAKMISTGAIGVITSGFFGLGFADWTFNASSSNNQTSNIQVTQDWTFSTAPISEGDTIEVDAYGNVTINGESVDGAIDYDGDFELNGGTVTMDIGVNDEGELVVAGFTATSIAITKQTKYAELIFPSSVTINDTSYPITGITSQVSLSIAGTQTSKHVQVVVPEGYSSICDDCFGNISVTKQTAYIYYSLPSTLEYLGNHTFNFSISKTDQHLSGTENVTESGTTYTLTGSYAGTKEQFRTLLAQSAAQYGSGYCFFTGASSNVSITCSNGTLTYNSSGSEVQ